MALGAIRDQQAPSTSKGLPVEYRFLVDATRRRVFMFVIDRVGRPAMTISQRR
jgi:hypothetical protein